MTDKTAALAKQGEAAEVGGSIMALPPPSNREGRGHAQSDPQCAKAWGSRWLCTRNGCAAIGAMNCSDIPRTIDRLNHQEVGHSWFARNRVVGDHREARIDD